MPSAQVHASIFIRLISGRNVNRFTAARGFQSKEEKKASIKEAKFSQYPPPQKKTPQSGFIPSSGIFISILCVGVILKDNKRNGQE